MKKKSTYPAATTNQWQAYRNSFPDDSAAQLLQRAILNDQPQLVVSILSNPALTLDINAPCEPNLTASGSPLKLALHSNNLLITQILLQEPQLTIVQSLPKYDAWSWVQSCDLSILQCFLQHPQNTINQQDSKQCTLLHEVVRNINAEDKLRFLLQQNDCEKDIQQSDGTTPLYRAALADNTAAVALLLQYPVNVNNDNHDNHWSVLHVATANNNKDIVKLLLNQSDININAKDDRHNTALHIASERGWHPITARLLRHNTIDLNLKNKKGWTALHAAAFAGHKSIVKQLLLCPTLQLNFVDLQRQTALHWAVQNGQTAIVKLLLKHPSTNVQITNQIAGHTALDIAQALGHTQIINYLQQAMHSHQQTDKLAPDDDYQIPTVDADAADAIGPFVWEVHGNNDVIKPDN